MKTAAKKEHTRKLKETRSEGVKKPAEEIRIVEPNKKKQK